MIKRLEQGFIKVNHFALGLMMFGMFVLVFTNIITRYFFSYSINWAEELARYLMVWTAFLGAGLGMREGRHVAIEVLHDYLPKQVRPFLRAFVGLIIITFMAILAYIGYKYASVTMVQQSPVLRWPIGLVYMVIPIGAIIFILQFITVFRDYMEQPAIDTVSDTDMDDEEEGGKKE
ncbi:TRAP transporter small permease [Peribacillus acanthi]|uniref:TRAP transporter small permease n=1 Tax=Peribacillus acanthi TaxID=2171554 RepID=UPI000D3E6841|nr:TRAP transporter small permease [Peribacillus acanthi]